MVIRSLVAIGFVASLAACTAPPSFMKVDLPPIEGIAPRATAEDVVKLLGKPQGMKRGYWRDSFIFDMDLDVWHYKGKGRVVFNTFSMTVYASEADVPAQGFE